MVAVGDDAFADVRSRHERLLQDLGLRRLQERCVNAISATAEIWLNDRHSPNDAEADYPSSMVWVSLEPLLRSLNAASCWELIDQEQVREVPGPPVIGHITANNTPLLPITSVVRALLLGSASIVKMPSLAASGWFEHFLLLLQEVDTDIASLVVIGQWPRQDVPLNSKFYESVDLVVAYGSDDTIADVTKSSARPVVGFGHRVSAAIVTRDVISARLFDGLASDILLYDQSGCLSIHTVFIEGDEATAREASGRLAMALSASPFSELKSSRDRAERIHRHRALSQMHSSQEIVYSDALKYTIILALEQKLHVSPTHCVIYVVPSSKEGIIDVIAQSKRLIQGIAIATEAESEFREWEKNLSGFKISRVCKAGLLQQPGIDWREDDRDVLRTLVQFSPCRSGSGDY